MQSRFLLLYGHAALHVLTAIDSTFLVECVREPLTTAAVEMACSKLPNGVCMLT